MRRSGYLTSGGGVAPFASELVAHAIASRAQDAHLAAQRAALAARARALVAALGEARVYATPRGGYFAWVRVPRALSDALARDAGAFATRFGVRVLPGARCDPTGAEDGDARGYVRCCFAHLSEQEVARGAERLVRACEALAAESPRAKRPRDDGESEDDDGREGRPGGL